MHNNYIENAYAMSFNKAVIHIEVYSVCRQRLIQTGSTNTITYDFEDGQNLVIGVGDRMEYHSLIGSIDDCSPTAKRFEDPKVSLQEYNDCDLIKKYEVPNRHKFTFNVHFSHRNKNKYKCVDLENQLWNVLLPVNQNLDISVGDTEHMYFQQDDLIKQENPTYKAWAAQTQGHAPLLLIGQPCISDETGYMKFRYKVRISTELELTYHMQPDYKLALFSDLLDQNIFQQLLAVAIKRKEDGTLGLPKLPEAKAKTGKFDDDYLFHYPTSNYSIITVYTYNCQ